MTPVARLLIAWSWDPTVIAGCAGLVVAYLWALRASSVPGEAGRELQGPINHLDGSA